MFDPSVSLLVNNYVVCSTEGCLENSRLDVVDTERNGGMYKKYFVKGFEIDQWMSKTTCFYGESFDWSVFESVSNNVQLAKLKITMILKFQTSNLVVSRSIRPPTEKVGGIMFYDEIVF